MTWQWRGNGWKLSMKRDRTNVLIIFLLHPFLGASSDFEGKSRCPGSFSYLDKMTQVPSSFRWNPPIFRPAGEEKLERNKVSIQTKSCRVIGRWMTNFTWPNFKKDGCVTYWKWKSDSHRELFFYGQLKDGSFYFFGCLGNRLIHIYIYPKI